MPFQAVDLKLSVAQHGTDRRFYAGGRIKFGSEYPRVSSAAARLGLVAGPRAPHTRKKGREQVPVEILAREALNQYRREDVLRILQLPARQLEIWERAGLIAPSAVYAFDALSQLRKLRDLAKTRISVKNIRRSVQAMRQVAGLAHPLAEAVVGPHRTRLAFRQGGALVDPLSPQLAFDFEIGHATGARLFEHAAAPPRLSAAEMAEMFQRAVRLEERLETLPEAKELYERLLKISPTHAASAINLGTICYNERDYARAEQLYRLATEADPEYALAFFDLGNVLDEQARLAEAIQAYSRALVLVPTYADAHYNLALAFERQGETRKALPHWIAYAQLDPIGPWSTHARAQTRRILASERLAIVSRHGRTMRAVS